MITEGKANIQLHVFPTSSNDVITFSRPLWAGDWEGKMNSKRGAERERERERERESNQTNR